MPEFFVRYGLDANPFIGRELSMEADEPLAMQASRSGLLLDIDGFAAMSREDGLDSYLRRQIARAKAAFVVIVGNEKSGASSAAMATALKYRELQAGDAVRFLSVVVQADDHSELVLYRRWAGFLYGQLQRKRVVLMNEVKQRLQDARQLKDVDTLEFDLRDLVEELRPAFEASPRVVCVSCFERIRTPRAIEIARTMFGNFPTLCIFTLQPEGFGLERFAKDGELHVVRLGALQSDEAQRVIDNRWLSGTAVPFHRSTFGEFCQGKAHPVGVVLLMAEGLLKRRAHYYEQLNGTGMWPADERLGFNDVETLESLEVLVHGGQ